MEPSSSVPLARPYRVRPPVAPPTAAAAASHQQSLEALEVFASTVTARKDAELYAQGDTAHYCYRILRGCVRTVKLMEDGRRQVNEFLFAGDWFGFDALQAHDFAAEAVSDVVLQRYPRHACDTMAAADVRIAGSLLSLATSNLRSARDRMVTLGRKTASERIAGFLLEMTRRMPQDGDGVVALPMNRGDMADHLGLTIETVCRCLAQFRRDGTIRLTRTSLAVQNREALRSIGSATRH